jgi:hypothetical protein
MLTGNIKALVFVSWAIVVCLAAFALGVTTLANWVVVACTAIVPPIVVGQFWRVPEQTISESIHEAQR